MFTKFQQRLIKETLLDIYRVWPDAINWPIYWLPWDDKDFDEAKTCIEIMNSLPEICWPEERCIVLAQEAISALVYGDLGSIVAYVPFSFGVQQQDYLDDVYYYVATIIEHNEVKHKRGFFGCQYGEIQDQVTREIVTEEYLESLVWSFEKEFELITDRLKKNMKEFTRILLPQSGKKQWSCFELMIDVKNKEVRRKPGSLTSSLTANDMLLHLCNIAIPSHYIIRSSFKNGFGPKFISRQTKNKPIFSFIHYDRLWKTFPKQDPQYQVRPHYRRSHWRRLWKMAGIDRFSLPDDPGLRAKIAMEYNVPAIRIPAMWVGEREFDIDDTHHKIITEPLVMQGYRLNLSKKIN